MVKVEPGAKRPLQAAEGKMIDQKKRSPMMAGIRDDGGSGEPGAPTSRPIGYDGADEKDATAAGPSPVGMRCRLMTLEKVQRCSR